jgi:hypothetical protein
VGNCSEVKKERMAKKNAFEELLASLPEEGDRQAMTGLAEKYPVLRESVLLRSDYSRSMDELKAEKQRLQAEADYAAQMKAWREANWVDNAYGDGVGALKRELEKDAQIAELAQAKTELEARIQVGDEVTFNDLNTHLDKFAQDKKFVSQETLQSEIDKRASGVKQTVDQQLAGFAHIALKAPRLAVRHFQKFNEELDTDGLVDFASKNGFTDLDAAYNAQISDRVREAEATKHAAELAEAEKRGRELAAKEMAEKSPARMPDDTDGPEMSGTFFQRINGARNKEEEADPPLGRIAATKAREWIANKAV